MSNVEILLQPVAFCPPDDKLPHNFIRSILILEAGKLDGLQ